MKGWVSAIIFFSFLESRENLLVSLSRQSNCDLWEVSDHISNFRPANGVHNHTAAPPISYPFNLFYSSTQGHVSFVCTTSLTIFFSLFTLLLLVHFTIFFKTCFFFFIWPVQIIYYINCLLFFFTKIFLSRDASIIKWKEIR